MLGRGSCTCKAVCVSVAGPLSILDLVVVVGQLQRPPGKPGIVCLGLVEVQKCLVISDNSERPPCHIVVKFLNAIHHGQELTLGAPVAGFGGGARFTREGHRMQLPVRLLLLQHR